MGFSAKSILDGSEKLALYDESGGNVHVTSQDIADLASLGSGMFNIGNEGSTWDVNNWNLKAGETFGTMPLNTFFGFGATTAVNHVKFFAQTSQGPTILMTNAAGDSFAITHGAADTAFASDFHIEFQIGGTTEVFRATPTGVIVGNNLTLTTYGTGTHAGAATFNLGVDVSGNVIEIPSSAISEAPIDGTPYSRQDAGWVSAGGGGSDGNGMFDVANDGGTWGVNTVTLPSVTTFKAGGGTNALIFQRDAVSSTNIIFGLGSSPELKVASGAVTTYINFNSIYTSHGTNLAGINGSVPHIHLPGSVGQVDFSQYGLGTFTGIAAYDLQVQADGQIIEGGAGMFAAHNEGDPWDVDTINMKADHFKMGGHSGNGGFQFASVLSSGRYFSMMYVNNDDASFRFIANTTNSHGDGGAVIQMFSEDYNGGSGGDPASIVMDLGFRNTSSFRVRSRDTGSPSILQLMWNQDIYFNQYTSVAAKPGTPVANLQVDSNGKVLTGALVVNGNKTVTSAAGNYTVLAGDDSIYKTGITVFGDIVTLPSAPATGKRFTIIDTGGNCDGTDTITLATAGAETISGSATFMMNSPYEAVTVEFNGTNYYIL